MAWRWVGNAGGGRGRALEVDSRDGESTVRRLNHTAGHGGFR